MWWYLAFATVILLFLVWADRRTRGRGDRNSGGAGDEHIPYPPM